MPDAHSFSQGYRPFAGASHVFTKFQSLPPLLALPAVGLAAWLATPYVVRPTQGHGIEVANGVDDDGTDGTAAATRSDPVTRTPGSVSGAAAPAGTAPGTSILARPIPAWLPLPAPAPASTSPASQPTSPRQTVQRPTAPVPRQKAPGRLIAPLPQLQVAKRSVGNGYERRPAESLMQAFNHAVQTGRSAAVSDGYRPRGPVSGGTPQWHTGGSYVSRGTFGGGAYRSFGTGGSGGGMRGGGGYGGGRHR